MCRIDNCESSSVSNVTHPKARKHHMCGECGRVIQPGETYENCFMVIDGFGVTFKMCAHCGIAAQWLAQNCGGYVYEEVREEIEEHAQEYPDLATPLLELAQRMRNRWGAPGPLMCMPNLPPPITVKESAPAHA